MKNQNTKQSLKQTATTESNQETRIQRYKEITKEKVGLQPTRQLELPTPKLTILCASLLFQPPRLHNIQLYASLQLPDTLCPKASHLCWLLA